MDEQLGTGADTPLPADYDGDGKADLAVWRESDNNWHIIKSSDQQSEVIRWGSSLNKESEVSTWESSAAPNHEVPVPADYDGDGKTDIAVWLATDGTWHIRYSGDQSLLIKAHGQAGDTPVTARHPRPGDGGGLQLQH